MTEKAIGLGEEQERTIEKWDQIESPEVPDRGRTPIKIIRPPGGGIVKEYKAKIDESNTTNPYPPITHTHTHSRSRTRSN